MKEGQKLPDEYAKNLIRGLKWIPIQEKAMEIQEEFEKRNEHDELYEMGLSDILYYALVLFHDDIINHEGDVHELIKNIRDEFITSQEKNVRFIGGFGALDKKFKDDVGQMRMTKKIWRMESGDEE